MKVKQIIDYERFNSSKIEHLIKTDSEDLIDLFKDCL